MNEVSWWDFALFAAIFVGLVTADILITRKWFKARGRKFWP